MNLADMLRTHPAHEVLAEIWRRTAPPVDPWPAAWPYASPLYAPTVYLPLIGDLT